MKYIVTSFNGDYREQLGCNLLELFHYNDIPARIISTNMMRNISNLRKSNPLFAKGQLSSIYDWYTGIDTVSERNASITNIKVDPTWIVHKGINHKIIYENTKSLEEYHVTFNDLSDTQIKDITIHKEDTVLETLEWDDRGFLFSRVKKISSEETERTIYHVSGSPVLKIVSHGKKITLIYLVDSGDYFNDEESFISWTLENYLDKQVSTDEWFVTDQLVIKQTRNVHSMKKFICCDHSVFSLIRHQQFTKQNYIFPTRKSLAYATENLLNDSSCLLDYRPIEYFPEQRVVFENFKDNESFLVVLDDHFSDDTFDQIAQQLANICQNHPQIFLFIQLSNTRSVVYWRNLVEDQLKPWNEFIEIVYKPTNEKKEELVSKISGCLFLRPSSYLTYYANYFWQYQVPCLLLENSMTEELFNEFNSTSCTKERISDSFDVFYEKIKKNEFSFKEVPEGYEKELAKETWGTERKNT